MHDDDQDEQIDETIANRKIARRWVSDAASREGPIAGQLADLENLAGPFYLGLDADPDDSDLDVFP